MENIGSTKYKHCFMCNCVCSRYVYAPSIISVFSRSNILRTHAYKAYIVHYTVHRQRTEFD